MLIVMKSGATGEEISRVATVVQEMGFRPHVMPGATRTAIGITGNTGVIDSRRFENLAGVAEVIRVSRPYKLITLDLRPEKTIVRVGDAELEEASSLSSPGRARSRVASRPSPWPKRKGKAARVSFAAACASHGLRLMRSRVWAKKAGRS